MLSKLPVICLLGPTASGKTPLAIELVKQFPCEIISVDSAMVYRGMDIGTAKPDAATLKIAPHHLIDIVDPSASYSAGQFRVDVLREIANIHARNKVPLLVGGTMLYFRVLQQGIATLPPAHAQLRAELQAQALQHGWEKLHAHLASFDPLAASRIQTRDSQRIQRAIEVYELTGKPISTWQAEETSPLADYHLHYFALAPTDRARLHQRIALRFQHMLELGFEKEVQKLYVRGDLSDELPAIRSVGYRQMWEYLSGRVAYSEMCEKALAATRQLAKRQITWLRSWPELTWLDADSDRVLDEAKVLIADIF